MNELLEKGQEISIVPQNFVNSNKAKVVNVGDNDFTLEVFHSPEGILLKKINEFYSPTKNGMLYFMSDVKAIDGKILTVSFPRKHRFLQRRAFTRIRFKQEMQLRLDGKSFDVLLVDLSAGGIKLVTKERLDIDAEYDFNIKLMNNQTIECRFEPIRIGKNEDNTYTLSGRFKELSNTDKMALIHFCMRKKIEDENK